MATCVRTHAGGGRVHPAGTRCAKLCPEKRKPTAKGCYRDAVTRRFALVLAVLGAAVGVGACDFDKTNDYDCESVWFDRKGEEVERETREYLKVESEQIAANRCKKDMLDAVPRGAKRAACNCVGRKAVRR